MKKKKFQLREIPDWPKAVKQLRRDPILKTLVEAYPGESLKLNPDPFATLLRSIVGQQISVKAADAVWLRLQQALPELSPKAVLSLPTDRFRECGLSKSKLLSAQDLSLHFLENLKDLDFNTLANFEVVEKLCQIRGIGPWTSEMFLIFHLGRLDVLPLKDLGLHKSISLHYGTPYPLQSEHLERLANPWQPYRSVAVWYLWRALDPYPVQY